MSKNNFRKEGASFIRCECGFEILLVFDLKMMARAIEAHAVLHGEKEKDTAKAGSEKKRIENALI
ncbi:hypothetical protein E4G67_02400, partial [Candidatus Bathyarchaeota archaeon]